MTKILIDRSTVEQALGALEAGPDVDPIFAGETADALRVALAEPDSDSPERRCGGPGCDMRCCQPVQEPVASAGLGPLPEPAQPAEPEGYMPGCLWPLPATPDYYTAEQMREYALRALAKPVQEPVAWSHINGTSDTKWQPQRAGESVQGPVAYSVGRTLYWHEGKGVNDVQLYLAPPQRPAKPQGCDHCNHPLYAATKCRVCGRAHGIGGEG